MNYAPAPAAGVGYMGGRSAASAMSGGMPSENTHLVPMRLVRFREVGLPPDSTDRTVWRFAQSNGMLLLTNNRNMQGNDSLEQTIQDENTATSLPVLTIGDFERITDRAYRENCAARLVEIVIYLDDYLGVGRLFIP